MIPKQKDDVIIGKPWIKAEDMIARLRKNRIKIKSLGTVVRFRNPTKDRGVHKNIHAISAYAFNITVKRARRSRNSTRVFAASLKDIEKALARFRKPPTDPLTKLPEHYRHQLECFKKELADKFPSHRPGVNHTIPLIKEDHKVP